MFFSISFQFLYICSFVKGLWVINVSTHPPESSRAMAIGLDAVYETSTAQIMSLEEFEDDGWVAANFCNYSFEKYAVEKCKGED